MNFSVVNITFLSGREKSFPSSDFDYYVATNELEHKIENLIITLSALERSFVYEMDDVSGEITNKEYLSKVILL